MVLVVKMLNKSHFLFLFVLFGIVFGAPSASNEFDKLDVPHNVNGDDESRIVRGKKVALGAYPFICSLQEDFGNYRRSKFCSGTIIDKQWIVTAAHCMWDYVQTGNHDQLRILCGTTKAGQWDDPGTQYVKVKRIVQHPEYNKINKHNDIALIEIDGEFQLSRTIFPICIAPGTHVPEEVGDGRIMGWGAVDPRYGHHGNASWDLLEANGTAINAEECKKLTNWHDLTQNQICVTHSESHVCAGDSGGPYIQFVEGLKRYCIVGIVSYGFANCDQLPSVFTKVSAYLQFIMKHLRNRN